MEYYKDLKNTKKIVGRKGPRDLQRQQQQNQFMPPQPVVTVDDSSTVKELRKQVSMLLEELAKKPVAQEATGTAIAVGYTAEEFDEELIKQVTSAVKASEIKLEKADKKLSEFKNSFNIIEKKYIGLEKERDELRTKLELKDELLKSKEETIETLKLRSVGEAVEFIEDPDRPVMETVFIDPNEKGDGDNLESHITVEGKEDEKIGDQINKLKGLIGTLPK